MLEGATPGSETNLHCFVLHRPMKGLLVLLEPRTMTAEMPTVPLSLAPQDIPGAQQAWKDFLGPSDRMISPYVTQSLSFGRMPFFRTFN